jgi:photosystem II stability/assembly factor-like uncharacterized protein
VSGDEQDRIDALLRESTDPLGPPDGAWERINRRARRRKWGKAGLAVAAGLVIVAGAVPSALAVRHSSDNQTLEFTNNNTPTPGPAQHTIAPAPSTPPSTPPATQSGNQLAGFVPTSVSFVSQSVGWLWGSTAHFGPGVIAKTTDGGLTWTRAAAPPVTATDPAGAGDSGIRYATGEVGYVFGTHTYFTRDAGLHWHSLHLPGRVVDVEAMNGRVWALVDTCSGCGTLHLYGAADTAPATFTAVAAVPPLTGIRHASAENPGTIAVNGASVYVMAGRALWFSPDGTNWLQVRMPCTRANQFLDTISAWSPNGVAAVCGGEPSAGQESKTAYESIDHGLIWTELAAPPSAGYPAALSAGSSNNILLGTNDGGGALTSNAGQTWAPARTHAVRLSFVGFISPLHVVGLADPNDGSRVFLSSSDAGQTWSTTSFPLSPGQ